MPNNRLEKLHLSLLEDLLPVGIALFERVQEGRANKLFEGFTSLDNSISNLREEGFKSAKLVREKLDKISPGLGNPILEADVTLDTQELDPEDSFSEEFLFALLLRMDDRLEQINLYLEDEKSLYSEI